LKNSTLLFTLRATCAVGIIMSAVIFFAPIGNSQPSDSTQASKPSNLSNNFNPAFAQKSDNVPPETLVYYNSWPGDHEYYLGKGLKMTPLNTINAYDLKDSDSSIAFTINTGEFVTLLTSDYYAYSSKSSIVVLSDRRPLKAGDTVYLMGYVGEGHCLVWFRNNIVWVPAEGIEGVHYYKEQRDDAPKWAKLTGQMPPAPDLWLFVMNADNQRGWVKYDSYRNWKRFGSSIFKR